MLMMNNRNGMSRLLDVKLMTIWQYFLIYVMYLVPGSTFILAYAKSTYSYGIIALFLLTILVSKKFRESYGVVISFLLLVTTLVTRFLVGGVGLDGLAGLSCCVLITQLAICCDVERFLDRWLNVVTFFAIVSVVLWALFRLVPSLAPAILGPSYVSVVIGTPPWEVYFHGRGTILYSFLENHEFRNCGVFTEPGKYQVVLNSALFILLFMRNHLHIENEAKFRFRLIATVLALITCQSTTGYIGMTLCFVVYLLAPSKDGAKKIKVYILALVLLLILGLLIQYWVDPENSVLTVTVFSKLFSGPESGFDLSAGTGTYREQMIDVCLELMVSHPLGVGYDALFRAASAAGDGLAAAAFVSYAAVYGIVPWLTLMFALFYPAFRWMSLPAAFLFVGLFINTTLAQTHLLYTGLILVPTYLAIVNGWPIRREVFVKRFSCDGGWATRQSNRLHLSEFGCTNIAGGNNE